MGCCWPCGILEKDCWPYWGGPGRPLFPPPKNELELENMIIAFETLLSSSPLGARWNNDQVVDSYLRWHADDVSELLLGANDKVNRGSFPDMLPAKTCVNDKLYNIAPPYHCP